MGSSYVATAPVVRWKGQTDARFREALLACTITMPAEGMDACELRLTDWGANNGPAGPLFDDVALGDEIAVEFGDQPATSLFRGSITGIEATLGAGAPQLTLLAEDSLHQLARYRQSRVYEQMSLAQVVNSLASDVGLSADCDSSTQGTWHQLNETNLGFLRRLAGSLNLPIRLTGGNTVRVKVPPAPTNVPTIDLSKAAHTRLRLVVDLNRQPKAVTAAGYDLATGQAITSTANSLVPAATGSSAASKLGQLGWQGDWNAPQPAPANQAQSNDFATAAFSHEAARFLHGELVGEGDPQFVAGAALKLKNAGGRFDGDWSILAAIHRFDLEQGYRCLLRLTKGAMP